MRGLARIFSYYYSTSNRGEAYSEELQTWIDKLDTLGYTKPDATFLSALDDLLATSLETGTVLSRMKTGNIYGFGSIEAGTVNIKAPNSYQHTLVNSPTYSAGNGVRSNGTSSYINSKYKINEYSGIESDLTTVLYVSESSTDTASTRTAYGSRILSADGGAANLYIRPLIVGSGRRSGYGAFDNFSSSDHKGLYILTYSGTQSIQYKDYTGSTGIKDAQTLTPSAPDLSNDVFLLAINNGTGVDSPQGYYNKYVTSLFRFDRFTDNDAIAFKAGWETFKTAVSIP